MCVCVFKCVCVRERVYVCVFDNDDPRTRGLELQKEGEQKALEQGEEMATSIWHSYMKC